VAFSFAAGCASTSPRPAFRDTSKLVENRIDRRITWNQGGSDDAAVAKKIRDLLSRTLDVDSAVQISLLNNKTLQATYEDLSVAQADLVQAGLLKNPVFDAGVSFPISGNARTGVDVSVSTDFLSVFVLAARKKVAEAELRATKLRVADAVLRTAADVQTAFYQFSAAQQIAAMRRTILEAGDAALDLAARQHHAGNISDLDLANQEALYEQVRTDLLRSESEVIAARESLTRLLGLWGPDTNYRVADKLPEMPTDEVELEHLETLAVGRRLDLGAAREEAQVVSHALAMAKNYRWLGEASSVGATWERAPEHFTVVGPRMQLEVPIFDQKQAVIARLEAQLRAVLARESALAIAIRSEVRAVRTRLVVARAVVDRYAHVVVPLRQRVVTLSQEQYNAMLLGAHPLLLAKQNEVNAYREFIESLRDYWTARADLERATGGSVPMPKKATDAMSNATPSAAPAGARP
jgi:cobalt-zinc-cadmium efflux system outer membrane protein